MWIPPLNIEWNGIPDKGGEIKKKMKSGTPYCIVSRCTTSSKCTKTSLCTYCALCSKLGLYNKLTLKFINLLLKVS